MAAEDELQALSESPRDVVGDVRLCRFLRFYSGDVAKVGLKHLNIHVCILHICASYKTVELASDAGVQRLQRVPEVEGEGEDRAAS